MYYEIYADSPVMLFIDRLIILITSSLCTLYLFAKIGNAKWSRKKRVIVCLVFVSLSFICQLFGGNDNIVTKIVFIVLTSIILFLCGNKRTLSIFPVSIIAVCLSSAIEYIAIFVSGIVLYGFGYEKANILSTVLVSIVQMLICFFVAKIKRINNITSFFEKDSHYGFGLLLSSYIIVFNIMLNFSDINISVFFSLFIGIPLALTGLILWIRSIVKHYYKNKLQDRANEYTKQEIEDKDKRIERLESEVSTLAKQLHRDNHLLSSLDRSTQTLADCASDEQRAQIIEEIHTMCRERNELIAKEQQQNKILPSTGIALIDGSLSEMYVKAAARGINFDLTVSEEPYYLVNNIISQTELQTLLCDHIKDAIIAVDSAGVTNGRILVTIEKNDGIFEIAVRDNGVDFDAETLAKLGREQITTHADDGGSGIGFMTTFETLRKTKGSLIITEYEQKTPFSKSVAFVFDGLNRFIVSTYRKEELEKAIDRDDILLI